MSEIGVIQVVLSLTPLTGGGNTNQNATARLAISVWGGAFTALVDRLKHVYPDDDKRASFGQRVVGDLRNPDYHLYSIAYLSLRGLLTRQLYCYREETMILQFLVIPRDSVCIGMFVPAILRPVNGSVQINLGSRISGLTFSLWQ
jgi:hypothetical protein